VNQKVRGVNYFRTIFYMPSLVSGVGIAVLWLWIFNPDFGILNVILSGIVLLIPFLWQATSSVKSSSQIFLFPPQWIPQPWLWSNDCHAFTALLFNIYFRNTMIVGDQLLRRPVCHRLELPHGRVDGADRPAAARLLLCPTLLHRGYPVGWCQRVVPVIDRALPLHIPWGRQNVSCRLLRRPIPGAGTEERET
jgi:hypothetical protein